MSKITTVIFFAYLGSDKIFDKVSFKLIDITILYIRKIKKLHYNNNIKIGIYH